MNKKTLTLLGGVLLLSSSCGDQKGDVKEIPAIYEDTNAPAFSVDPFIKKIGQNFASLMFSVNEPSFVVVVARPKGGVALSTEDVNQATDGKKKEAKPYETVRVKLDSLIPGTSYEVYLTMEDAEGNALLDPIVVEFKTMSAKSVIKLGGAPKPAYQGVRWKFVPKGLSATCSLELVNGPSWLKVLADGDGVGGVPSWSSKEKKFDFEVKITGDVCEGSHVYSSKVLGDPLYDFAWHLNPDPKGAFSWFHAPLKIDNGIAAVHELGVTGENVTVAIVDSGLQIKHPDLKENVLKSRGVNLDPLKSVMCKVCDSKDTSPPEEPGEVGDQGTGVAGVIAAKGWNEVGSIGVAPKAKIFGYNLFAPRFQHISETDHQRVLSLDADIICQSGVENESILAETQNFSFDAYDRAQKTKTRVGRDGKGTIYIKAAGELSELDGDAVYDQRAATSWGMVVGAHSTLGVKSLHSSGGANLWISAPGGERGYQSQHGELEVLIPTQDFFQGMIAPDITSCTSGYAKDPVYFGENEPGLLENSSGRSTGFNLGWHKLNEDCDYTASLRSSPAATGVVAGSVALLLEVFPDLTWRDVRHVLATTADPIDINIAPEVTHIGNSLFEKRLPWVTNAAGYRFHNWYGFGAMNIHKAFELLQSGEFRGLPEFQDTKWILAGSPRKRIPPASISGVFADYFFVKDYVIESVQIKINITHEKAGSIGIELVSPNGTRSILKAVKDGAQFSNLDETVFLSNAFYGERARGNWQIRVVDARADSRPGSFNSWYMRVTGHMRQ